MTVLEMMDKIYETAVKNGGHFSTEELRYDLRCTRESRKGYRDFQRAVEYMRILGWIRKPGRNGIWALQRTCVPFWKPKLPTSREILRRTV